MTPEEYALAPSHLQRADRLLSVIWPKCGRLSQAACAALKRAFYLLIEAKVEDSRAAVAGNAEALGIWEASA